MILFSSCKAQHKPVTYSSTEVKNHTTEAISPNYQNTIFLDGQFKMVLKNKNQIFLYTETNDSRHIFLLDSISSSSFSNTPIQTVSYLKNGILLNNSLFLGVNGQTNTSMVNDVKLLSKSAKTDNFPMLKSLAHYWYSKKDSVYNHQSMDELINTTLRFEDGGDCTAGGTGSTGCSIGGGSTGCSVSCGAGYHACCNVTLLGANDCHCVAN